MAKSQAKMVPVAVFDISSSSVAGAHVLIPKGVDSSTTKVSLLASTRLLFEPKEDINIERFVETTMTGIQSLISTLQKADAHIPRSVHILLASPWFVSQTRTIVYSKESPFVCTEKLVDSLIEKEIAFIIEHDMGRFGSMGKEGIIIEKQISLVKLNGYSTAKPFGKKAQSLELFLIITVSPKVIIEKFKDQFQKGYPHVTIQFTTSPYATFVVTRDFLQAPKESMIIDIGEEITDIACVKDELFLYQQSFPVGIYQLYRTLSAAGHTSINECHALIESFKLGKLSAAMTSATQKALEEFGDIWKRALSESIDTSAYALKLPETMYTISDDVFVVFFGGILQNDPFISHAVGSTSYTPIALTYDLLAPHVSSLDPEHIDETLIIGSLFASRLL